jgi:hypothetical protein
MLILKALVSSQSLKSILEILNFVYKDPRRTANYRFYAHLLGGGDTDIEMVTV